MRSTLLLLSLCFFTNSFAQLNGHYTLGGAGANFSSFNDLANALASGVSGPVKISVTPGTYNEQVTFPVIPGASATNIITIKGNLATLSFNSQDSLNRCGIILNGTDHLIIDSLIVDGSAGKYAWGVLFTNKADSNQISHCTINVSKTDSIKDRHVPVVISGSSSKVDIPGNNGNYNVISENKLNGGYHGICIYGDNTRVSYPWGLYINLNKKNVISKNIIRDVCHASIKCEFQFQMNIEANDISRPDRNNSTEYATGISAGSLSGSSISSNRIYSMFKGQTLNMKSFIGLYVYYGDYSFSESIIKNNLVYDIEGNGDIYGILQFAATASSFYHNTIVLDNPLSTTGNTYGISRPYPGATLFKNNIIYVTRAGAGASYAIEQGLSPDDEILDYNVYYFQPNDPQDNFAVSTTDWAVYFKNFSDWTTNNYLGHDQHSLHINPAFENPSIGNYKPTSDSLNNKGENLGVTLDINGVPRTYTPDPGAYEFSVNGHRTYIFKGNGNWSDASNWMNNQLPPNPLPAGNEILIYPSADGKCLLDIPFALGGGYIAVKQGKEFLVNGNLVLQ